MTEAGMGALDQAPYALTLTLTLTLALTRTRREDIFIFLVLFVLFITNFYLILYTVYPRAGDSMPYNPVPTPTSNSNLNPTPNPNPTPTPNQATRCYLSSVSSTDGARLSRPCGCSLSWESLPTWTSSTSS